MTMSWRLFANSYTTNSIFVHLKISLDLSIFLLYFYNIYLLSLNIDYHAYLQFKQYYDGI